MLTKQEFQKKIVGHILLDGATGSNLMLMGMPRGCCTEQWVLEHPETIISLQRQYAEAGSGILYAPTFQAQPMALEKVGLEKDTEAINAKLVALSRQAAPDALIAGDITTLSAFCDTWDPANFDLLVENYRRQIRGLIDGGADLLAAETLVYPQDAEAILTAAELEGAGATIYSFTMQSGGILYNGVDAGPVLKDLEDAGAAAVGFNCVAADMMTPYLVSKLRRFVKGPLLCKPNAGNPVIGDDGIAHYDMAPDAFSAVVAQCKEMGARLLGGCCGTTPKHIAALRNI